MKPNKQPTPSVKSKYVIQLDHNAHKTDTKPSSNSTTEQIQNMPINFSHEK